MAKVTTAQLHDLLLALTIRVNELTDANVALAQHLTEAHARIDHAATVFKALRQAVTPMTPRAEPARMPRAEFDRALEDLRADAKDAGLPTRIFTREVIAARAATLRAMAAQTAAAAG